MIMKLELWLRQVFSNVILKIASVMVRLGLRPNIISVLGFLTMIFPAYFFSSGNFILAGFLLLVLSPLDALDGATARLLKNTTKFGSFIDSVLDRLSEFLIYGGLLVFYLKNDNPIICIAIYLAVLGSMMVSYTRARAESLNCQVKIGVAPRSVRIMILSILSLLKLSWLGIIILAILTIVTTLQRIFYVRQMLAEDCQVPPTH